MKPTAGTLLVIAPEPAHARAHDTSRERQIEDAVDIEPVQVVRGLGHPDRHGLRRRRPLRTFADCELPFRRRVVHRACDHVERLAVRHHDIDIAHEIRVP